MIYVYRRRSSEGARNLVDELMNLDKPARRWSERFPRTPRAGDLVICWGEAAPVGLAADIKVLNGAPIRTKFDDALKLREAGVRTIEVSRTLGPGTPVPDPAAALFQTAVREAAEFSELTFARSPVMVQSLNDVINALSNFRLGLATPAPRPTAWLARRNDHVGGNDLLITGQGRVADFYAKKEEVLEEYRLHIFNGKSIRAGVKKHRVGFVQPHPWIRSYDAGWFIDYAGFESSDQMKEIAKRAVSSLGLQFGAVDIGKLADGSLIVFEVNRAPGLEGGSAVSYANAVVKFLQPPAQRRAA